MKLKALTAMVGGAPPRAIGASPRKISFAPYSDASEATKCR